MDRLSFLDDAILTKIVSYLPTTKEAVRTSVLCKSFRRIWTNVTNLIFVLTTYNDGLLIDHVISNRNHQINRLDRFAIIFSTSWIDFAAHLPIWVEHGIRLRPRHVTLHLRRNSLTRFLREIFSLSYLESLDLRLMTLPSHIQPPRLSNLRLLRLRDIDNITSDFVQNLLSACHLLEELSLDGRFDVLDVSSPGLRRLSLKIRTEDDPDGDPDSPSIARWQHVIPDSPGSEIIRVKCPNLEWFDFSDSHVGGVYEGDLPALSEAHVSKFRNDSHLDALLGSLQNASVLHFTPLVFKLSPMKFFEGLNGGLPTFHNLRTLHLEACFHDENIDVLICLLEYTPNLQSLNISIQTGSSCNCETRVESWTSRKLPFEFLHHLKDFSLSNDSRSEMVNKCEFVKFLSINVKEWASVTKMGI